MTTLNTDYTRFTYQDLLEDFYKRLKSDDRFKNISSASIYGMFMEMMASCVDMTNFYMSRTAEEAFIDTARLDSSIIKHGKNLGYNPVRNTPAEAEIQIVIKGPLPSFLKAGAVVYFSQEDTNLSFNNNPFMLDTDYSYTFTAQDIADGVSPSWTKTLNLSVPVNSVNYNKLGNIKMFSTESTKPIKVFQGKIVSTVFDSVNNYRKIGKTYQFYDIDDIKFSNWYGQRDPNGFFNGEYSPKDSYTKIAIGNTEEAAFDAGYFTIEDESIYLNKDVLNADSTEISEPYKVCSITTNSDKTVRITFGDGRLVSNGLNNENEKIYVQYLQTEGSAANSIGTIGSNFTYSNKFYATQEGNVVDVTANIKLVLATDITNGANFESKESIKINAPAFYASNKKLITKQDFISFFKTLTNPIKVNNAIAWTVEDFEKDNTDDFDYDSLLNYVFYCIVGTPYNINDRNNSFVNVLLDDTYKTGKFTVYGNGTDYLNHLVDYVYVSKNPEKIMEQQYNEHTDDETNKDMITIRKNCEDRMMINTKLFSLPPIVQYYDVCGDIEVNSLSKLQSIKTDIENKIYKWLNDNCRFNQKIYKSDIQKIINENNAVRAADIDIKVSDLLYTDPTTFTFNTVAGCVVKLSKNKNLIDVSETGGSNSWYNVLILSTTDSSGNKITKDMFTGQSISIELKGLSSTAKISVNPIITSISVNERDETISIPFLGTINGIDNKTALTYFNEDEEDLVLKNDNNIACNILMNTEFDFTKTSNLKSTLAEYGLKETTSVNTLVNYWINPEVKTIIKSVDRAIDLPYTQGYNMKTTDEASDNDPFVRSETFKRYGNIQGDNIKTQVTEHAYWDYFVPTILYPKFKSQIDEGNFDNFESLVLNLYIELKHVLADSILDDNNNIVNYSMSNEIPVVRLNMKYRYRK